MCLGEYGTVVREHGGVATVEFDDGSVRDVSTAILAVDRVDLAPGDRVLVSMGFVLSLPDRYEQIEHTPWS